MIKIFISHQQTDTVVAASIAQRLKTVHGIDSYVDAIDPYINRPGEDIADYIRREMGKCTQLMAVVSPATKASQWVPWEIGVATEKDFPLATFGSNVYVVPEFLEKWPFISDTRGVDEYAKASKEAQQTFVRKRATLTETAALHDSTREFYRLLRSRL
jgi:hypothetical protein